MADFYDTAGSKEAANLTVDNTLDLQPKSRTLNINISATLERALKEKLAKYEAAQWVEENSAAIKSYNEFVEQNGCFSDEFRSF